MNSSLILTYVNVDNLRNVKNVGMLYLIPYLQKYIHNNLKNKLIFWFIYLDIIYGLECLCIFVFMLLLNFNRKLQRSAVSSFHLV